MRIGSLCSGYGGLDIGVQAVIGGDVAWHVEYDDAPSRILAHHWPHIPNHGDLTTTDWHTVEPVDILTAGYPCQPFSHAGKRKGTDDPRHLWPHIATAVGVLRPRLVVLENVAGHLSLGMVDVLGDLAALGYDARWLVVRAADAGAPHGRARVFIVAHPDDAADDWQRSRPQPRRGDQGAANPAGDAWWLGDGDGLPAADCDRVGRQRFGGSRDGRTRPADGGLAPADAARYGRDEGRPESAWIFGRPDAPERGRATAPDADSADGWSGDAQRRPLGRDAAASRGEGRSERGATTSADADDDGLERLRWVDTIGRDTHRRRGADIAWGVYEPAIRRWERLTRPAPDPTEPGRNGPRLAPSFVEWMMGLDPGHVTSPAIGLTRNQQLKALGNGVVPQQAALALHALMDGGA